MSCRRRIFPSPEGTHPHEVFREGEHLDPPWYDPLEGAVAEMTQRVFRVIVIYDIPCDRRRSRLSKALTGYGTRIQLSAFECHLTPTQLETLKTRVRPLIVEAEDLLRIYKLSGTPEITVWGNVPLTRDEPYIII
jgi:CRISPR-associated protein Cas2